MRAIIGKMSFIVSIGLTLQAENLPVRKRNFYNTASKPVVEVFTDKKKVYVGEPVSLTVRFVYDKQSYKVQSLIAPACLGGIIRSIELIAQRDETVKTDDGASQVCGVCEWRALVLPSQEGKIILDPFQVVVEGVTRTKSFFGFSLNSTNTFFSQTLMMEAFSLPKSPYDGACAVGSVQSVSLACDKPTLSAGQACTLTYCVNGFSNAASLPHPELSLPEGLKLYPSMVREHEHGVIFEYVLQAVTPGRYTIGQQTYNYFDTECERYSKIATNELSLYVMQGLAGASLPVSGNQINNVQELQEEGEVFERPIISRVRRAEIPPIFFVSFTLILIVIALLRLWYNKAAYWLQRWYIFLRVRFMLKRLRDVCKPLGSAQDLHEVYEKFKDLHHMINFDTTMGSRASEWQLFWKNLEIYRFGDFYDEQHVKDLIKEAREWIDYVRMVWVCKE